VSVFQATRSPTALARPGETLYVVPSYCPDASVCQGRQDVSYDPWQDSALMCVTIPLVVIAVVLVSRWVL
jgi:hypothetical protein